MRRIANQCSSFENTKSSTVCPATRAPSTASQPTPAQSQLNIVVNGHTFSLNQRVQASLRPDQVVTGTIKFIGKNELLNSIK